jgi:GT2 family glycosyltransferase
LGLAADAFLPCAIMFHSVKIDKRRFIAQNVVHLSRAASASNALAAKGSFFFERTSAMKAL